MSREMPPPELRSRAGGAPARYDAVARHNRRQIESLLPGEWSFDGKRILDFGCGAGRLLAVFADRADRAEFVGCDLHAASITWAKAHLTPPFEFFLNGPEPPLDQPPESFDLVWGISVFTHVTDNWAAWLAEIHRVLRPCGLAVFSFLGEQMWRQVLDREDWDADRLGMAISMPHRPWDHGGPEAFHSEWWLRAHWGRAFEIVRVEYQPAEQPGHGWIVLRRDERPSPTPEALEAPVQGDEREVLAGRTNVALLSSQLRDLYAHTMNVETVLVDVRTERDEARREITRLGNELEQARRDTAEVWRRYRAIVDSRSWALTRPLRQLAQRVRTR